MKNTVWREDENRQIGLTILLGQWKLAMVNVRVGWMGGKDLREDKKL
jgi:hypothetical protein